MGELDCGRLVVLLVMELDCGRWVVLGVAELDCGGVGGTSSKGASLWWAHGTANRKVRLW